MHPAMVTAVLQLMYMSYTVAAGCRSFPMRFICGDYQDEPCDDGWSRLDVDRCVKYINSSKTFHEAQEHCHTLNGDLVSLHGYDEMFKVFCLTRRAVPRHQSIWIGAQRSGTVIKNIDGSDFKVLVGDHCDSDRGPEACIKLNVKGLASWSDARCSRKKNFVCAKNM